MAPAVSYTAGAFPSASSASSGAARTAEKVGVVDGFGCFPEKVNPAKKLKTEPRAFLLCQSTYP
jgi:hypothetical protein